MLHVGWRVVQVSWCAIVMIVFVAFESARPRRSRSSRLAAVGRRVARSLERLGGGFVKLGQMLSTRPDMIPREIAEGLEVLQERCRPMGSEAAIRQIEQALGRRLDEVFSSFDEAPLAVGSVAQVHVATLGDGRVVAVKVRHPDVARRICADVRLLLSVARALRALPGMKFVPVDDMIREWCDVLAAQVDLRTEAASIRRFRDAVLGENVVVPDVMAELSSESVVTMEYVPGLAKGLGAGLSTRERSAAASLAIDTVYRLVFDHGLVHADLHPGNLIFVPGPKMVLLDFGFVSMLDEIERQWFRDFFLAVAAGDSRVCARVLMESSPAKATWFDERDFQQRVAGVVNEFSWMKARDFEVAKFASRVFDVQRVAGLAGSARFTMAISAFLVFEGVVKQLDGDVDFLALALERMERRGLPAFFSADRATAFVQGVPPAARSA